MTPHGSTCMFHTHLTYQIHANFIMSHYFSCERVSHTTAKNKIKPDLILKNFWRNNERFADLFNTVFFNGQHFIQADTLIEF